MSEPCKVAYWIDILLLRSQWECPPESQGVVPAALEQPYARVAAALHLGELDHTTPAAIAALVRATFTDPYEDVRNQSLQALRQHWDKKNINTKECSYVFYAAAFDPDFRVRATALEGLWYLDEALGGPLAQSMVSDPDPFVGEIAGDIVSMLLLDD